MQTDFAVTTCGAFTKARNRMTPVDWSLLVLTAVLLASSLRPRLQGLVAWRVIVTPLASIIGSGFLVIAPLLGMTVGGAAPWAMLAIVILAYGVGAIIRFNILYAEPMLKSPNKGGNVFRIERASNVLLSVAYVVSVAFYLRLMAAFVLRGLNIDSDFAANSLTSGVLVLIGLVGWRQGLHGLERLEKYSVTIKLCIIFSLLVGLGRFDYAHGFNIEALTIESHTWWDNARALGGMLLVVQGFETSRYMGEEYAAIDRVRGMRSAQWLATAIYVTFVFLISPLLHWVDLSAIDETSIIDLAGKVAVVLPPMLIVAAIMSQFSAAVADTVGAGGLVAEESGAMVSARTGYLVVSALAILLVWTSNIFEIISIASRAFAGYYFAQALVSMVVVRRLLTGSQLWFRQFVLGCAAIVLLWIVMFATAAI